MDNSLKFEQYREKYKEFYFNSYTIKENEKDILIEYEFEIPMLTKFNPKLRILKKDLKIKKIKNKDVQNMVFNIGLVELISYWKSTCSPKIIIKCGNLTKEQKNWWKKLYFYGLGEFFYTNNINTNIYDFVNIECAKKEENAEYISKDEIQYEKIKNEQETSYEETTNEFSGYIVPIGGGKDSIVTLETLKIDKEKDYCLIINPKQVTLKCAQIAGFNQENIIEIYRDIDKNLINLNKQGFLNGHTPFSAMLAFLSYFIAYILSKKYIALSNENSANESNIIGEKINHQYSKSYEFECDFEEYANKYLKMPIKYFSFLRPLNELQIAKIFSKQEKYHKTFKSCNVGSKEKEWKWCCNCAKCLFAYIILSPYLYKEKLVNIFKEDLFEKANLKETFLQLTGNAKTKPFDCVGTFEEVNFAISKTIKNIEQQKMEMPYLLKYYKDNYKLIDISHDITKIYNEENNLNEEQNSILKKEVFLSDK